MIIRKVQSSNTPFECHRPGKRTVLKGFPPVANLEQGLALNLKLALQYGLIYINNDISHSV